MKTLIHSLILVLILSTTSTANETYRAHVISVYDADTFTVNIDVGFHLTLTETIRVMGIDTPELRTKNKKEKELGYKARDYVKDLILDKDITIIVYEEDKYGRYLIDVIFDDGKTLTEKLIEKGYGYAYDGGTKRGWDNL